MLESKNKSHEIKIPEIREYLREVKREKQPMSLEIQTIYTASAF